MVPTALISVFDKRGIVDLARSLHTMGYRILSSGNTHKTLTTEGIPAVLVSEYTGSQEILDGRVKTLHPKIHGGILAKRDNSDHINTLAANEIAPIDVVVCNLYPFRETVKGGADHMTVIETIDIGGPSMIRSAAKNHRDVWVVVDPDDYTALIQHIQEKSQSLDIRQHFAAKAFEHTYLYDAAIAQYFSGLQKDKVTPVSSLTQIYTTPVPLRYGENSHQQAVLLRDPEYPYFSPVSANKLQGKSLSYNNYLDITAAIETAMEYDDPTVVIVKHLNPCGIGSDTLPEKALQMAMDCDKTSFFGGVIGTNLEVTAPMAARIAAVFIEAIIAPSFTDEAKAILAAKKNLRVLELATTSKPPLPNWELRTIPGGVLAQHQDLGTVGPGDMRVVTHTQPSDDQWTAMRYAWKAVKFVKSNAIVLAQSNCTVGIGAGQMSRVDAVEIAIKKATDNDARFDRVALASDAFFPFPDSIDRAHDAGIQCIIQPGGSIKDAGVIARCNDYNMSMVFTGHRHFRH